MPATCAPRAAGVGLAAGAFVAAAAAFEFGCALLRELLALAVGGAATGAAAALADGAALAAGCAAAAAGIV